MEEALEKVELRLFTRTTDLGMPFLGEYVGALLVLSRSSIVWSIKDSEEGGWYVSNNGVIGGKAGRGADELRVYSKLEKWSS